MVRKKRNALLVLAMIMLISVFTAACGSKNDPADSSNAGSGNGAGDGNEKVSITILSRASGTSPAAVAFQNLLKKFMDENPNITVVDESLNDENAFNNKLKTSLATGNVPHIWTNYGGEAFKDYAKNIALDLQPYLDEDTKWSGDFLPLLDTWQYKDLKGTYGVPSEFYSIAIYYNKELFEKIGMAPPTTVEEMAAVSAKFKEIGITPMAIADKENFRGGHMLTNLSLKKFGQAKTDALVSGEAKWNDADMLSLFQLMKDWQDAGILGKNIVTTDNNAVTANFIAGKSAMLYEGSWGISQLAESAIADKVGVISFPGFADAPDTKDIWFGGAGGYSVSKEAKGAELDAAVKLVKFLTSVESFQYYLEFTKGGVYPVKMTVDPAAVDPVTQAFMAAQNTASGFKGELYAYDPIAQLQDKVRNEIQGMFAGNSPQKTADAIQSFIESNRK
ncbi:ABC transporter substrate-binding protein [Paenibacillus mendelii]|uniref:ABC transporter substrate-binding protein n=1 Tax=Paenibacillus mendelii TaxID=206163 RepID=A0ABV6JI77_9BACL|nr:extracellular solute-binding protein [Paenibacillus mendelii]MCQ6558487.1 extracellular solute-binding protein [Paenibacillus mendelii]